MPSNLCVFGSTWYVYICIYINFACHVQMSKFMFKKPRHLFIKNIYFGSLLRFHIYIYIYIQIEIDRYGDICVCVFMENSVLVSFSRQDFHIIPGGVCYLPGETFTTRSHPGNFFEIWNFARWVKQSPPRYWERVFK